MNKKLLPLLFALMGRQRSVGGWITIAAVAVVYLMVQPTLNAQFGLKLPGLFSGRTTQPAMTVTGGDETLVSPETSEAESETAPSTAVAMGELVLKPSAPTQREQASSTKPGSAASDSTAQRSNRSSTNTPSADAANPATKHRSSTESTQAEAPLGKLTEVGPKVFETTAGLRYGPGSVDGHRLLHIMEHAKDRPDKPVHGVFEGDEFKVRAMIDEAYLIADLRGPPQARKTTEGQRTIWKVDMKRKVGYLGGQVGKRKGRPSLTGIQLVLEGQNVITAYPIDPRR